MSAPVASAPNPTAYTPPSVQQMPSIQSQADPTEVNLLNTIEWANSEANRHALRADKYKRDADFYESIGDLYTSLYWLRLSASENWACCEALGTRDRAMFDLAQLYLHKGRTAEAIELLKKVEESEGGSSQLGIVARQQLYQLGHW